MALLPVKDIVNAAEISSELWAYFSNSIPN